MCPNGPYHSQRTQEAFGWCGWAVRYNEGVRQAAGNATDIHHPF